MDLRNEASAFHVQYRSDRRRLFNVAYRRVRDIEPDGTIEQADLSFVWPIADHWRTIGRWNVALDGERNQDPGSLRRTGVRKLLLHVSRDGAALPQPRRTQRRTVTDTPTAYTFRWSSRD